MAGQQDVIQLPVRFLDPSDPEGMALAIQRNFVEVERYLSLLQSYIKQISGGSVKGITDQAQIWDRAANINSDGTIPTSKLTDKLVGLQHELQLAEQAVTEAEIAVAAIDTEHLKNQIITEMKIVNEAVTAAKIAASAIRSWHIEGGAITLPKTNFPHHYIY